MPAPAKYALLWTDGLHTVSRKSASGGDAVYLLSARRVIASRFRRTFDSMDSALHAARQASARWLKEHPEDKVHFQKATLPAASNLLGNRRRRGAPVKDAPAGYTRQALAEQRAAAARAKMSYEHFAPGYVNPVAQIYKYVASHTAALGRSPGRPRKDGARVQRTTVPHRFGDCAVIVNGATVLDEQGYPRVFTPSEAEEYAENAYYNTPEEERFFWRPGSPKLYSTRHIDVIFTTEDIKLFGGGRFEPFVLVLPDHGNKVIFIERVILNKDPEVEANRRGQRTPNTLLNAQASIARDDAKTKARKDNREYLDACIKKVNEGLWDPKEELPFRHICDDRWFERFKFLHSAIERAEEIERERWG